MKSEWIILFFFYQNYGRKSKTNAFELYDLFFLLYGIPMQARYLCEATQSLCRTRVDLLV